MAAPLYIPLDPSRWQFRILKILPGSLGTMIKCELQLHTLYVAPKYAALSYCWGDEHDRRSAVMDQATITITANLEEALQQLRTIGVERVWIDALCINQNDIAERSLQVRFMPQIYSKADITYAWIGNVQSDNAALGIQFLQQITTDTMRGSGIIQTPERTDKTIHRLGRQELVSSQGSIIGNCGTAHTDNDIDNDSRFEALNDLFNRPYWRRRWIIQELIMSRTTQVVCGELVLSLDCISRALKTCENRPQWTPRHSTAYRFLRRILDLRYSYYSHQQLTLIPTIFSTKDSLSKDERDKVFALVGICKDGNELVPTPNYEESPESLNINLTKELLRKNVSFDIISIDKGNSSDSLPSWCPNWLAHSLPVTALTACENTLQLSLVDVAFACHENGTKIFTQGVAFGSVVAMSSVLSDSTISTGVTGIARIPTHKAQEINYYGSQRATATAIYVCLLASSVYPQRFPRTSAQSIWGIHSFEMRLQALIDLNRGAVSKCTPCWPLLDSWLKENKNFLIGGYRLQDLTSRPLRYYLARTTFPYRRTLYKSLVKLQGILIYGVIPGFIFAIIFGPRAVAGFFGAVILLFGHIYLSGLLPHPYGHTTSRTDTDIERLYKQLLPRARLILLDTGAIALASANTQVGDKLCLIAGCTSSVILRGSGGIAGEELYSVVGQSFACMSPKDAEKYEAFAEVKMGEETTVAGVDKLPNDDYTRLIGTYKNYEEWRTFVLV